MIALGLRVALSTKLREGKLAIVSDLTLASGKTKVLQELLETKRWDNALFFLR